MPRFEACRALDLRSRGGPRSLDEQVGRQAEGRTRDDERGEAATCEVELGVLQMSGAGRFISFLE